jgi:ferritin-like metal-binding protein YciE
MMQTSTGAKSGPQAGTFNPEDARKLMIDGLRNAHGLEQQAIELLERNAERLQNYPELKARVTRHLEESRQQQRMVAQALEDLGESPSSVKDTVMGMAENAQMMVHAMAGDEVLKNAYTGYAFEHFEIASYKALIVMARAAGDSRVESIAQQILRQEEEMATWLEDHLPQIVSQYIVQMGSGQAKR